MKKKTQSEEIADLQLENQMLDDDNQDLHERDERMLIVIARLYIKLESAEESYRAIAKRCKCKAQELPW